MKDDLIFVGAERDKILERGSFFTRFASEIESDPVGEYTRARQALEEVLGLLPQGYCERKTSKSKKDYM